MFSELIGLMLIKKDVELAAAGGNRVILDGKLDMMMVKRLRCSYEWLFESHFEENLQPL